MDWSRGSPELKKQILEESNSFLSGTVAIAASADQRAAVMAGTFTAAATAIVAGLMALGATAGGIHQLFPVYAGGVVAAAAFAVGALFCVLAMMPANFYLPGSTPAEWEDDVIANRSLEACRTDMIQIAGRRALHNRGVIAKNASRFLVGVSAGIFAPFAGLIVWGLWTIAALPVGG